MEKCVQDQVLANIHQCPIKNLHLHIIRYHQKIPTTNNINLYHSTLLSIQNPLLEAKTALHLAKAGTLHIPSKLSLVLEEYVLSPST